VGGLAGLGRARDAEGFDASVGRHAALSPSKYNQQAVIFPKRPGGDYPPGWAAVERAFLYRHGFDPDQTWDEIFGLYMTLPDEQRSEIVVDWWDELRAFSLRMQPRRKPD
jgi:hypothetical protein